MILKDREPMTPNAMASDLIRQMDVLREHKRSVIALELRIAGLEQRYAISTSQVHAAIEAGTLQETIEVCDWIIDSEILERSRTQTRRSSRLD